MKLKIDFKNNKFYKRKDFWICLIISIVFTMSIVSIINEITNYENIYLNILFGICFVFLIFYRSHNFLFPKLDNPLFYKEKGGKKK